MYYKTSVLFLDFSWLFVFHWTISKLFVQSGKNWTQNGLGWVAKTIGLKIISWQPPGKPLQLCNQSEHHDDCHKVTWSAFWLLIPVGYSITSLIFLLRIYNPSIWSRKRIVLKNFGSTFNRPFPFEFYKRNVYFILGY